VRIDQGLLAHAVAGQHPALSGGIPQGNRKHPPETLDEMLPLLLIEVHGDLGVRAGGEAVAPAFQVGAQLLKIIDLAVEDDGHRAVLVADGLRPPLEVDDAKAARDQPHTRLNEIARLVRPAVDDGIAHAVQQHAVGRGARCVKDAGDAAHPRGSATRL